MDAIPDAGRRYLGKYRLDGLLGKGGMGEVYAAYDTTLDRVVALKTIRAGGDEAQQAERFRREGRAAARLRHPLIVTVYELGEAEGKLYMAMEYLEGASLAAAAREGRLSPEQKLEVVGLLLDGLQHAHSHGVVHRDVKPSNVQVLPDGAIKILDFGIARLAFADSMSHTGMVLGTVPYMSPEQLRGERVDQRTDIYAAGVVAYELFAGRRPFDGQTLTEIVLKVINDPLPPMDSSAVLGYPGLESILARALDKSADARFDTAAAMAHELRTAARGPRPENVGPVPAPASTTYRVPLIAMPHGPSAMVAPPPVQPEPRPDVQPCPVPPRRLRSLALGAAVGVGLLAAAGAFVARHAGGSAIAVAGMPPPGRSEGGSAPPAIASQPQSVLPIPSPMASPPPPLPPVLAGHGALARGIAAELKARGGGLRAGERIDARLDVALRRAPFTGSSAVTADFTATAILTPPGRAPRRCDVTGHALEFSDTSARAASVARAAEQLAECLAASRSRR